jgi:hypothetical protein
MPCTVLSFPASSDHVRMIGQWCDLSIDVLMESPLSLSFNETMRSRRFKPCIIVIGKAFSCFSLSWFHNTSLQHAGWIESPQNWTGSLAWKALRGPFAFGMDGHLFRRLNMSTMDVGKCVKNTLCHCSSYLWFCWMFALWLSSFLFPFLFDLFQFLLDFPCSSILLYFGVPKLDHSLEHVGS